MRILYIDQYFSDRGGISGTRGYEFSRRWVDAGHQVTVITAPSRYSSLSRRDHKKFIQRFSIEGINVISIRVPYAQQMGIISRLYSFLAFMFIATMVGVFLPRHDVVFASSTPLTVGVPGSLISRLRGTPFVFEVRDLWPRAPIELGVIKNPLAKWIAKIAERLFYRLARHVVALSPGMASDIEQSGVPPNKISMIPNACDFDLFDNAGAKDRRRKLNLPAKAVIVVHAGNLGPSNDGKWLIDLAACWKEKHDNRPWLLLLGEGSERSQLEQRARRLGLDHVVFAGPFSRREAAGIIKACDIGIVSFADYPVLATNSPNKFFDYLAAGLPAAVNTNGWTAKLLQKENAGLALGRQVENAAAMLADLAEQTKKRRAMGKAAYELGARFERGKLSKKLIQVLHEAQAKDTCGLEQMLKRLTDLALAGVALLIGWPIFAGIAWAIKRDSDGAVFYRQERVGKNGRVFRIWKFRTMVEGAEALGDGLNVGEEDPRVTRVGHWLRDNSLDEIPQIFNVLSGDMSLVGPRPALNEHVTMYNETQRQRLRARPGITGLAQVSGRNLLTWDEKLGKDVQYVQTWSWWKDFILLGKTIPVVCKREGLYEPDAGKTDRFNVFEDDNDDTDQS